MRSVYNCSITVVGNSTEWFPHSIDLSTFDNQLASSSRSLSDLRRIPLPLPSTNLALPVTALQKWVCLLPLPYQVHSAHFWASITNSPTLTRIPAPPKGVPFRAHAAMALNWNEARTHGVAADLKISEPDRRMHGANLAFFDKSLVNRNSHPTFLCILPQFSPVAVPTPPQIEPFISVPKQEEKQRTPVGGLVSNHSFWDTLLRLFFPVLTPPLSPISF